MSELKQRYEDVLGHLTSAYRARGYTVERDVELSGSGSSLTADLVARRGEETVVIEVRFAASRVEAEPLRQYAEFATRRGWRFIIAVADTTGINEVELPAVDVVRRKIGEVQTIPSHSDAAVLMAWSVLEGAARVALAAAGSRSVGAKAGGAALLQELAALGRITRPEERELLTFAAMRDRLAHGVWNGNETAMSVNEVLAIAERLVAEDFSV